jgi:hypothetical protein
VFYDTNISGSRGLIRIPIGSQMLCIGIITDTLFVSYGLTNGTQVNVCNISRGLNYVIVKISDLGESSIYITSSINNGSWSVPVSLAVRYTNLTVSSLIVGFTFWSISTQKMYLNNITFSDKITDDLWDFATLQFYSDLQNPTPPTPTDDIIFWMGCYQDNFSNLVRQDYYNALDYNGKNPILYAAYSSQDPKAPEEFLLESSDYPILDATASVVCPSYQVIYFGELSQVVNNTTGFRLGFWWRVSGSGMYVYLTPTKTITVSNGVFLYNDPAAYINLYNKNHYVNTVTIASGSWKFYELKFKDNKWSLYQDGVALFTDTSDSTPTGDLLCVCCMGVNKTVEMLNVMVSSNPDLDMWGGGTGLCIATEYPKS